MRGLIETVYSPLMYRMQGIASVMALMFALVFIFLGVTQVGDLQTLTSPSITNTATTAIFGQVSFFMLMTVPIVGIGLLIGIAVMLMRSR